jgi:hypothetical protein
MVQPPDAETEQGKVFRGKLLPFAFRDGDGQGKGTVEELLPKGIQTVEKQENILFKLLRRMSILEVGMVEDAKEFIVHGIVGGQILVFLPGGDVTRLALAKPFAVGLGEENMHFVSVAVRSVEGPASQGIGPAGAGAVGIDAATAGGHKRAAGPAIIHHAKKNLGKGIAFSLLDERILVEKGRGGKPQMSA